MRPLQMPMGNPQGLSILNPRQFRPQGIGSYLGPLLSAIQRDYHQDKIEPYVQDVENLTTQTFPDFDLGGGGTGGGIGGPDFGGGQMFPPGGMPPIQAQPGPIGMGGPLGGSLPQPINSGATNNPFSGRISGIESILKNLVPSS